MFPELKSGGAFSRSSLTRNLCISLGFSLIGTCSHRLPSKLKNVTCASLSSVWLLLRINVEWNSSDSTKYGMLATCRSPFEPMLDLISCSLAACGWKAKREGEEGQYREKYHRG